MRLGATGSDNFIPLFFRKRDIDEPALPMLQAGQG